MKAITLTQPFATAVVMGYKAIETRSWRTSHRGPLAIHAAKGWPRWARDFAAEELALGRLVTPMPLSAVLCVVKLRDCIRVEEAAIAISQADPKRWGLEHRYGDFAPGRWAWILEDVEVLAEPVPAKGSLGLWEWDATRIAAHPPSPQLQLPI